MVMTYVTLCIMPVSRRSRAYSRAHTLLPAHAQTVQRHTLCCMAGNTLVINYVTLYMPVQIEVGQHSVHKLTHAVACTDSQKPYTQLQTLLNAAALVGCLAGHPSHTLPHAIQAPTCAIDSKQPQLTCSLSPPPPPPPHTHTPRVVDSKQAHQTADTWATACDSHVRYANYPCMLHANILTHTSPPPMRPPTCVVDTKQPHHRSPPPTHTHTQIVLPCMLSVYSLSTNIHMHACLPRPQLVQHAYT